MINNLKNKTSFWKIFLTLFLVIGLAFNVALAEDDEDSSDDESDEPEQSEEIDEAKELPIIASPTFVQDGKELLKLFSDKSPASSAQTLKLDDYYADQVISTRYMTSKNGRTTTWFLMYTRSADIIETLTTMFEGEISDGDLKIAQNPTTNAIIVRGKTKDSPLVKEVLELIRSLDFRTGQVLIDVLVVELTISDEDMFNLELKGLAKNPLGMGATTGIGAVDHGVIDLNNPLASANGFKSLVVAQDKWKLFVNAYKNKKKANIISSPHIVAANHRKSTFKIGDQVPLITSVRPSDAGPIKTFEVKEVGIELSVTPHINRSGQIDMEVFQSINNIKSYNPTEGTAEMSNREVETNITLGNGETLILGGFIEQKTRLDEQRIPLLSNIPFIGKAFTKKQKTIDKTELLVFLTPRLLETKEDNQQVVRAKTDSISQKDKVRKILDERRKAAKFKLPEGVEVIIPRESRGWLYDFDTKQIEDIVWEVPPKMDPSKLRLLRYGSCPFAYGESKSLKPPFIKTLLRPSEGFVFYKEFTVNDPDKFRSLILKVASCNAAAVYLNGVLIDEDPMIKLKDGHDFEYWNRIKEDIPPDLMVPGVNNVTVFLGNDKSTTDGYFDMSLEGIK